MANNNTPFKEYFKAYSLELNWDYIDTIPEFQKLKECEQTPKWHSEGNAYIHVRNCVEKAYEFLSEFECKTDDYKKLFIMSVLFHDIGKITTTKFIKEDWHSYNHEIEGEAIARRILWDQPVSARETICSMVRWHMERCGLARCKDIFDKCRKLWYDVDMYMLYYVMKCDVLGSTPQDLTTRELDMNIIETMKNLTISSYIDGSDYIQTKRHIFYKSNPWVSVFEYPKVIMLIGLPGAGKDTYIQKIKDDNTIVVCRDDIRVELGYCKPNEKKVLPKALENKVTEVFDAKILDAASKGKNIIINNINLKRKYREAYRQMLSKYNYEWIYQYIEAPTLADNIKRREGQISPEIFDEMINKFEWPRAYEYDVMYIQKQ